MKPQRFRKRRPQKAAIPGEQEISGVVENVVYHSEDTGYTVCAVNPPDSRNAFTLVGSCAAIWVGEDIKATGRWTRHPKHGEQFDADSIACSPPTSVKGIEKYLGSGMLKGIGKVNAKRIVKAFGKDTLRIIEKESKRLEEVEGIGEKRRKMIKESWNEQKAVRDIMIFLQSHGVGIAHSARIYRQYGDDSIALIMRNPYRLCAEVWGIGFKTADGVAQSLGIPQNSPLRARAGVIHVLSEITDEGHCYCPESDLISYACSLLEIDEDILRTAISNEVEAGHLVRDKSRIYLSPVFHAETGIAEKLALLLERPADFRPIEADKAISWAEKRVGLTFADTQRDALRMALTEKVSIITGGPGVGKTTIIRALVDVFKARRLSVALAAPTGRAAKRMEEATGQEAKTIHRMLKYIPRTGHFEHGPDNPLEEDVIILDEVSMVDVLLMHSFLAALPDRSLLILVGDVDQLPSVGPGNVLRDLIESTAIPSRKLETIFRQEAGGWIVQNAHRVNRGEKIHVPQGDDTSDFYFIHTQDPEQVIQRMLDLVTHRIRDRFGFDPLNDVQVLTPMRRNQLGADNLNVVLQKHLNPSGPAIHRFGRDYRLGDRVMQIRNNYDKGVFNGDIGRIAAVDTEELQLAVDFDSRRVAYDACEIDELVHAYACSIHKAQGSEYPAVVILLATQHFKLLQRNLLYTAITRGRRLVCLIGSWKAVHIATANNRIKLRRTGLKERLAARAGVRILASEEDL